MDMVKGYGDKNPIVDKSPVCPFLYERITDDRYIIGPKERVFLTAAWSVCIPRNASTKSDLFTLRRVAGAGRTGGKRPGADVGTVYRRYFEQFSHPTNIETENRLISFNTRGMVEDMKDLGQLVITDHMINRVSQNWENGVRTHIFLDEFHTLLQA